MSNKENDGIAEKRREAILDELSAFVLLVAGASGVPKAQRELINWQAINAQAVKLYFKLEQEF